MQTQKISLPQFSLNIHLYLYVSYKNILHILKYTMCNKRDIIIYNPFCAAQMPDGFISFTYSLVRRLHFLIH